MKQPIVTTKTGKIQGKWIEKKTIADFKGIPYAQPPVGELRWKAPQAPKKWEGVKQATKFQNSAWQQAVTLPLFLNALIDGQGWSAFHRFWVKSLLKIAPSPKQSEDCLYLNIKTPSIESSSKLPVMVWIHGGDHQDGGAAEIYYDGVAIPKKGIVLVTINYRLGLMGYFAHPELSKETKQKVSGNYGTLDQIAALEWVQENITAFGGDPNNVTIFGESAGGESVAHMLSSPLAKGLFHNAILQSPANSGQMTWLKKSFLHNQSAETSGVRFIEELGLSGKNSIDQLRKMPAKVLMQKLRKKTHQKSFFPAIDGYVLPKSPFEVFFDKEQVKVPMLLGSNSDEGTCVHSIFQVPIIDYRNLALSNKKLPEQFHQDFPKEAEQLLRLYPGLNQRNPKAEMAILGDEMFGEKVRFYAEHASKNGQSVYFYQFRRTPPSATQTAGAYHAAEIPFVHGTSTPILPLDETDKKLSSMMIDYWTTFAKKGNPNQGHHPKWEAFDANNPQWMLLDTKNSGMTPIDRAEKYELLNAKTIRRIRAMKKVAQASLPE